MKSTFVFKAFLLKKALHDSHVMASKLYPRALSPQTPHTSKVPSLGLGRLFCSLWLCFIELSGEL